MQSTSFARLPLQDFLCKTSFAEILLRFGSTFGKGRIWLYLWKKVEGKYKKIEQKELKIYFYM
jgi:hypothetical protein